MVPSCELVLTEWFDLASVSWGPGGSTHLLPVSVLILFLCLGVWCHTDGVNLDPVPACGNGPPWCRTQVSGQTKA